MDKIILCGKQLIDGEINFENITREFNSFEEYRKFYEEIRENAESMYGNDSDLRVGVFGFRFSGGPDDYEEWVEVIDNDKNY